MRRLPAFLLLAFTLVGCSSPDPNLYTAAVVPGTPQPGGPPVVLVREVALARYLQRPQIVRSAENYRLDVMSNDWWGEPLAAMLSRVLAEGLSQRLPGSTVYAENGAVSANPDATLEVNVQRLDEDASGALVLVAQAAVVFERRRAAPVVRSFRIVVPPPASGVQGEVAAVSAAVGQMADGLAALLRQ